MKCNNQGIIIPNLEDDPCNGDKKSTACVVHTSSIPSLDLPEDSTQEDINNAIIVALNSANNRIVALETLIEDLENRIVQLETA